MKKSNLKLSTETIRILGAEQLRVAAGGCTGCSSMCGPSWCDSPCGPPIPPPPPSFGPPAQCWP